MTVARWWREGQSCLRHSDKQILAEQGRARSFTAGEPLHGSNNTDLVLIQGGRAKVVLTASSGRELLLSILGPGDLVGIYRGLGWVGGTQPNAWALSNLQGIAIPPPAFERFLDGRWELWKQLAEDLAEELAAAQQRLLEMAFEDAGRRLARILIDMIGMEPSGRRRLELLDTDLNGNGARHIASVTLTQSELASLLGTRRETVERKLRAWRERGIVATGPRAVNVLRLEDLARLAGVTMERLRELWGPEYDSTCSHPIHWQHPPSRDAFPTSPVPAKRSNAVSGSTPPARPWPNA